jgi:hypothetical protein
MAGSPFDVAMAYLTSHAADLRLSAAEIRSSVVTDEYRSPDLGVTHIYFRQQENGLPIVNANLNINVTDDGRVLSVGSDFVPHGTRSTDAGGHLASASGAAPASGRGFLSAREAMNAAAFAMNLRPDTEQPPPLAIDPGTDFIPTATTLSDSTVSEDPIPVDPVYVATADGLILAWSMVFRTPGGPHLYDVQVDAASGALLGAADRVKEASYNVFALPMESPYDGSRTVVTDPADPAASPYGWHDTNGSPGAEYTDTRGNSAFAAVDYSYPSGGSGLSFDFPLDVTAYPSAYTSAAAANAFYWVNMAHDLHYHYGFTEAAGNFQQTNYTGEGLGNDAVQVVVQSSNASNNAYFAPQPDGTAPTLALGLWYYATPTRDSDLESTIILHEYGHGVSTRLVGGPANVDSLNGYQSGGMGEGWGDWWGLMFTQKPTDTKMGSYPIGNYARGQPSTGGGIRRYPYSFDMSVDPLTYGAYNSSNEVHKVGEIWCSVLWDLNWLLIEKYGYSSDVMGGYHGAGSAGNILALQLVEDSLKLMPARPTFLDARNAILQADGVLTGGVNRREIWTAFARRGMGASATDGGSDVAWPVSEAFDMPPPGVAGVTPSLISGLLRAGTTSLQINFSDTVIGGDASANYELRSAGPDDLLGTADDPHIPLSASSNDAMATVNFSALTEGVYRLTIHDTITDSSGVEIDGDGDLRPGGDWVSDFVVVPAGPAPVTLQSPGALPFDIGVGDSGAGQLIQGTNNAFDGDGRLLVGGQPYQPDTPGFTLADNGRTVVVGSGSASGLSILRKVFVPAGGNEDFARTVDSFTNNTGSSISTTVTIVGNLGSNASTRVFGTSSGDTTISPADQWIGTDDNLDGGGTPAVIHYIHGPLGLQPSSVTLTGDNIQWTYNLTVPAGQTVRLAYFTIVAATEVAATSEANALVAGSWFGGQADAYLTTNESSSLANFRFPPPTVAGTASWLSSGTLPADTTSLFITFSKPVIGADVGDNYRLQATGPDGLLGTADDLLIPLTVSWLNNNTTTLAFPPLVENGYRLTVRDSITDGNGNLLQAPSGTSGDWIADFVVVGSRNTLVNLTSMHAVPFQFAAIGKGAGQLVGGLDHAFDGDGRLIVGGEQFQPASGTYSFVDNGRSVVTGSATMFGLTVSRELTVPGTGTADLVRTVDTFVNASATPITTTVTIAGNLGSNAATRIFATSDGDAIFTPEDQWVGTDDADGTGAPAIIHYIHGTAGSRPTSVSLVNDNIQWTYSLTVPAGQTVRLACFTVVATTRSAATAAAGALLSPAGFDDQARAWLTPATASTLANFVFPATQAPTVMATTPSLLGGTLTAGVSQLAITFSEPVAGANMASNYQLQESGADGLLATADDLLVPLTAYYRDATATLIFRPLLDGVYRVTVRDAITDWTGNPLQGSAGTPGDWSTDFVVLPGTGLLTSGAIISAGGYNPDNIAAGDFNGDGSLDLAVSGYYYLGILLGDGLGRFSAVTTYNMDSYESGSVVVADFDRDGKLDLAVTSPPTDNIAVLFGDGSGRFSTPITIPSGGAGPRFLASGDLNGDSNVDLAIANSGSGTVTVLSGDGGGGFAAPRIFASGGSAPSSLAVADFTGDGRLDLAVTNSGSNSVTVLLNDGRGGFDRLTYDSGGSQPNSIATGDFNQDGTPDLVVVDAGIVEILLNNSAGGFTIGSILVLPYGYNESVAVADFNGDGQSDLAVTSSLNYELIFLGSGSASFSTPTVFSTGGSHPTQAVTGDFNSDGSVDLAVAEDLDGSSPGLVGLLLGNGSGGFAPARSIDYPADVNRVCALALGDFNRDGRLDVAAPGLWSRAVGILLGNAAGGLSTATTIDFGGLHPADVAAADFNADGKLDLAVSTLNSVDVLLGDGAGGFALTSTNYYDSSPIGSYFGIAVGDFDGDGPLDLAVFNSQTHTLGLVLGDGTGHFSPVITFHSGGSNLDTIVAADFNQDGKMDVAITNSSSKSVAVLIGDSNTGLSFATTTSTSSYYPTNVAAGDFNGDGNPDLVVEYNSYNSWSLGILLGDGHGGFSSSQAYELKDLAGHYQGAITVSDVNGDGHLDVAAGLGSLVSILLGNGTGTFSAPTSYSTGGDLVADLAVGDFNADGRPDLAVASNGGNVSLMRNTQGPSAVTRTSPHAFPFEISVSAAGAGQLVQGSSDAFDGDGRLLVGGTAFRSNRQSYSLSDGGRSVVTANGEAAGLTVSRKITVPNAGNQDFARTVDTFTNDTSSPITTTVTVVGNLGSNTSTTVFATSNGDTLVTSSDRWIGTDDADGTGTPAIIHYIHGPSGLQPNAVQLIGDNITWTYQITVAPGQTVRLAYYIIIATTRADAEAASEAMVSYGGFGGQAAAFLTQEELDSISNYQFPVASLDADGNGTVDALSDGILILRYMFDPTGAWNFNDALGSGATRTTRDDIRAFLDGSRTTVLDADGNGTADALSDGILILRYLFAPVGSWSYGDAVGVGATRTTRDQIRAFLDQFNPSMAAVAKLGTALEEPGSIGRVEPSYSPIPTSDTSLSPSAEEAPAAGEVLNVTTAAPIVSHTAAPAETSFARSATIATTQGNGQVAVQPSTIDPRTLGLVFAHWYRAKHKFDETNLEFCRKPAADDDETDALDGLLREERLVWAPTELE